MSFQLDIVVKALPALGEAALITAQIAVVSFALALCLGIGVGVLRSRSRRLSLLFFPYVEIFRGTPLLIQLFFLYYGLPTVGITMSSFQAAIVGLTLNGGAYVSEAIRGGLMSVKEGQRDASYALGMNWAQTMRHVILPQAMTVAVPPLMNIFSSMLKETSLVSVLAITELTRVGQLVYTRTFRAFEIYLAIGLVYLLMTVSITLLSKLVERRLCVR